jgi:hypothetical protein
MREEKKGDGEEGQGVVLHCTQQLLTSQPYHNVSGNAGCVQVTDQRRDPKLCSWGSKLQRFLGALDRPCDLLTPNTRPFKWQVTILVSMCPVLNLY